MISNNNKVSFHYAIDDKEIVQVFEKENFYGTQVMVTAGNEKLSVEICYSKLGKGSKSKN